MKKYKKTRLSSELAHDGANSTYTSIQMHGEASQLTSLDLHRAIRLPEVLCITGLSRSGWYALINPRCDSYDSDAPRPFKLGKSHRSPSAWWLSEVLDYLRARSDARIVH